MLRQANSCGRTSESGLRKATILTAALFLTSSRALAQQAPAQNAPRDVQTRAQHERRIVVSIPDRKLALLEDGHVVKIYSVAVGAPESPSPAGHFQIVHRIANPTYYAPGVVMPPGAENPLGTRWIGLDFPHFGIHGTNQPRSIGHNSSHGCIRMRNRDAEDLFERVRAGDAVELIAERTVETAQFFGGEAPKILSAQAAQPAQASAEAPAVSEDQR